MPAHPGSPDAKKVGKKKSKMKKMAARKKAALKELK